MPPVHCALVTQFVSNKQLRTTWRCIGGIVIPLDTELRKTTAHQQYSDNYVHIDTSLEDFRSRDDSLLSK